jgi:hypothetical protein
VKFIQQQATCSQGEIHSAASNLQPIVAEENSTKVIELVAMPLPLTATAT